MRITCPGYEHFPVMYYCWGTHCLILPSRFTGYAAWADRRVEYGTVGGLCTC